MSSAEELDVIERIVHENSEYAVYTNLSRLLEKTPSSLSEAHIVEGDNFERRGLGWVMALARVELGAMLAGFTEWDKPFERLPPTAYELPMYKEIMLDSLRTHYAALRNDPVAQHYWSYREGAVTVQDRVRGRSGLNEQNAIAYGNRVSLAASFARAIRSLGRFELATQQVAQLESMDNELDTLGDTIYRKVLGLGTYSAGYSTGSSKTIDRTHDWHSRCRRLTAAARLQAQANPSSVEVFK